MMIHAAEGIEELKDEVQPALNEVKGSKGKDFKYVENVKKAEATTKAMQPRTTFVRTVIAVSMSSSSQVPNPPPSNEMLHP